jgi:hypothetical protein
MSRSNINFDGRKPRLLSDGNIENKLPTSLRCVEGIYVCSVRPRVASSCVCHQLTWLVAGRVRLMPCRSDVRRVSALR